MLVRDILGATNGELLFGSPDTFLSGISTDSRKIEKGQLFIPLEGEKFDGHEYIEMSLKSGAAAALTHKDILFNKIGTVIKVKNTLKAFGDIALYHRNKFDIPLVAVTGSVGKTSTKDMIASILGKSFNVLKTQGNFNNEIGLPKTLLQLKKVHEAAVVEMGMRGFGEIDYLSSIARPNIAVITNIGLSHIERLGSRENILKAKLEILNHLNPKGYVILNGDDSLLKKAFHDIPYEKILVGTNKECNLCAEDIISDEEGNISFKVKILNRAENFKIGVPGIHNVYNALCGIAVGMKLGLDIETIKKGVSEFVPSGMRMEIKKIAGITIINDTYNASPQSMEATIGVLSGLGKNMTKVAVLGDMLELGDFAVEAHKKIGEKLVEAGIDYLIAVGQLARYYIEGASFKGMLDEKIKYFENNSDAISYLLKNKTGTKAILVKGSRAMKMEEIVEALSTNCQGQ